MKDIIDKEIKEGDTIVHVGSGTSPYLHVGKVLRVEEGRIQVIMNPRWRGDIQKEVWLRVPGKIAVISP